MRLHRNMRFALSAASIPENGGEENEELFHGPVFTCFMESNASPVKGRKARETLDRDGDINKKKKQGAGATEMCFRP